MRDELHDARVEAPERRDILLIGSGINFIDVAGAELLAHEAKLTREAGGTLYLCNLKPAVRDLLERGGFLDSIGRDCVFEAKDDAIRAIYARLDSSRCRSCDARIFTECAVDAAGRFAAGILARLATRPDQLKTTVSTRLSVGNTKQRPLGGGPN